MKKPDMPPDERLQLQTLRSLHILDTPPEERFDRLTRLAKRMFRVPFALVNLVDENRGWFKSCMGLEVIQCEVDTSRDASFCGHTILGDAAFIIPNTLEDPRFADNPLVLNEPKVRFYAGCPLTVNGHKLGTLCILDQQPRSFEKEDIEALKDLASMVEQELAAVQLAAMDGLTNISNRRSFMTLAQHSLSVCVRQNISAALVFLDLDKFKSINDQFGHAEGDAALIAFAGQIKSTFRDSDLFARLGGDEFVALLSNASKQKAEEIIERFSHALTRYNQEAKRGYEILFSHGVVEFNPEKHSAIEALLAEGDALMYEVKKGKTAAQ